MLVSKCPFKFIDNTLFSIIREDGLPISSIKGQTLFQVQSSNLMAIDSFFTSLLWLSALGWTGFMKNASVSNGYRQLSVVGGKIHANRPQFH